MMDKSSTSLDSAINMVVDNMGVDDMADDKPLDPIERKFQAADRALQQGNSDLAMEVLDNLLREHPTHFRSLMLQSAIAKERANYGKAEMYARAALRTLPKQDVVSLERAMALSWLAEALRAQGKSAEANEYMALLGGAEPHLDQTETARTQPVEHHKKWESADSGGGAVVKIVSDSKSGWGDMRKEFAALKGNPGQLAAKPYRGAKITDMATGYLWSQEELYERKVVFVGMRQREVINAFREVRIKLLNRLKGGNFVVLVSSLKAAGGASFFGFNLAATFALDPAKTAVYVDCNPYDSAAERYMTQDVALGLSHYLVDDQVSLEDIIYQSGVERVRVVPSAAKSESAAELFNSQRMQTFIRELKSRYPDRFIILDAPSVEHSTEARILSQFCDQALLLVPFGKVTTDEVASGIEAVGPDKFCGLIFNR